MKRVAPHHKIQGEGGGYSGSMGRGLFSTKNSAAERDEQKSGGGTSGQEEERRKREKKRTGKPGKRQNGGKCYVGVVWGKAGGSTPT